MNACKAAIYSKLTGDSTLTNLLASSTSVYEAVAPQEADAPYVIYFKSAGTPNYTFTDSYEDQVYTIKGVTQGPSAKIAGQIAERIDAVLTDGALTLSGRSQMYLRRIGDVELVETDSGVRFNHSGGTYRLITQST